MTAAQVQRPKVILRAAPKRIDAVCEKIVTQLSLHVLLNKAKLCQGLAKSGEVETALNRLVSFGIVCQIDLQVDYNLVTYYFLRTYSDIVGMIFKRRQQAIEEYSAIMQAQPRGDQNPEVVSYEPEEHQRRPSSELDYVPLKEFMRREVAH